MRSLHLVGLGLAALATILWMVALLAGGPDLVAFVGLTAILVGFLVAAWTVHDPRRRMLAVGFVAVGVGVVFFYRGDLWSSIYNLGGLVFALGAFLAAGGAWRNAVVVQRLGLLVAAVGSLVWVYADLGAWWWQPGNLLMAVGCATAAWGAGRQPQDLEGRAAEQVAPADAASRRG